MLKTIAIKKFLEVNTFDDLANLYNAEMEVQVNVARDGGTAIKKEYRGKPWTGWTDDGGTVWKNFRIPYKANTEPEYIDKDIGFDICAHAEGIGMTGWNWVKRRSQWVAYDFDSLLGHNNGLSQSEIDQVIQAATEIPWVTVRRSTSGKGIHLYVFLPNVETSNHGEHAALARSILGLMSAEAGFSFESKVDICGGNMWVWHRKMQNTKGLEVLKTGRPLLENEVPRNWREHIKVIKGSRRRTVPQDITKIGKVTEFEQLTGQRPKINLDETHRDLLRYLQDNNHYWVWDDDNQMLITHTFALKLAYQHFHYIGFFDTTATGKEIGADKNCFCFPLPKGGWVVRRYSLGVNEHNSWSQDNAGWTYCYYNREPDLRTAIAAKGGVEDKKGGFHFTEACIAIEACSLLNIHWNVPPIYQNRPCRVVPHKDGRLVIELKREVKDTDLADWLPEKDTWVRILHNKVTTYNNSEGQNFDDLIRHVVSVDNHDCGWAICGETGQWRFEPLTHIRVALSSLGYKTTEVSSILGSNVVKPFILVNRPFEPEYPGNREWNHNAAQLRYQPTADLEDAECPTWLRILKHCGKGLDEAILSNEWCQNNGIVTGQDYLFLWIANIIQNPYRQLPYLFFWSPTQETGKSIFHEALSLLVTKGSINAKPALTNPQGFNGEMDGAIICYVEEENLAKNIEAYNRIKSWVTAIDLPIHPKKLTPYLVPNTTHWIQCANDPSYCPIFSGDTRITMIKVPPLEEEIAKYELIEKLKAEAPHFLGHAKVMEIPRFKGRLAIPVIDTDDKRLAEYANMDLPKQFLHSMCETDNGCIIRFSVFYDHFISQLEPAEAGLWTKQKVGKSLQNLVPRGRLHRDNQFYLGNIRWKDSAGDRIGTILRKVGDHLIVEK